MAICWLHSGFSPVEPERRSCRLYNLPITESLALRIHSPSETVRLTKTGQKEKIMKRYRILKFGIDATRNILNLSDNSETRTQQKKEMRCHLSFRYGENDFDNKFIRYMNTPKPVLGVVEEYWYLLNQIVDTYTAGYFYPALTGACCLGERIFNVLLLRLRDYYTSKPEYKTVYNKDSFDDWKKIPSILYNWKVIDEDTRKLFERLGEIRHDSIHYQRKEQDLCKITSNAIFYVNNIANKIFGILNRKDILLLFNVPGEIYIKKESEQIPLVREFYIPSALFVGYKHTVPELGKIFDNELYENREISDDEFIKLRTEFNNKSSCR